MGSNAGWAGRAAVLARASFLQPGNFNRAASSFVLRQDGGWRCQAIKLAA